MVNDVARAFFEAPARRKICVELPAEETHEGDDVGLLLQSLHETRDASSNFQEEVRKLPRRGSQEASATSACGTADKSNVMSFALAIPLSRRHSSTRLVESPHVQLLKLCFRQREK